MTRRLITFGPGCPGDFAQQTSTSLPVALNHQMVLRRRKDFFKKLHKLRTLRHFTFVKKSSPTWDYSPPPSAFPGSQRGKKLIGLAIAMGVASTFAMTSTTALAGNSSSSDMMANRKCKGMKNKDMGK